MKGSWLYYPLKVLVASSDEYFRQPIKNILSRERQILVFSDHGDEVIDAVTGNQVSFDVVLLDGNMPSINVPAVIAAIEDWEASEGIAPQRKINVITLIEKSQNKQMFEKNIYAALQETIEKKLQAVDQLDSAVKLSIFSGSDSDYRQTLKIFNESVVPELNELLKLLKGRYVCEEVEALSHKIKSSAYVIGANKLGDILQGLNQCAKEKDTEAIADFFPYLKKSVLAVTKLIQA